jgi:hypothetical protein
VSSGGTAVHLVELGVLGAGGAAGYEADGADDEGDAEPAGERELLVQPVAADEGDDHRAKGCGGHDEGEVGPAERCCIGGEEADEEEDAEVDVGVEEGVPEEAEVVDVDGADLVHAALEERVADGGGDHDGDEDGVLRGSELVFH